MKFSNKEILRAKRDLKNIIDDISHSNRITYVVNIRRLINIIRNNAVLNTITSSYLKAKINFKEIEKQRNPNSHIELNLPDNMELEIAYVLQKIALTVDDKSFDINYFTYLIFNKTTYDESTECWNNCILRPCLRELLLKIDDLIEDEVQGKDTVDSSKLVIKVGNISLGNNSNIAVGKDINQNANQDEIFDKLLNAAKSINNESEKNKILNSINEMKNNTGKKSFANKYNSFIQSVANHMTIFAPLIPLITPLLNNIK